MTVYVLHIDPPFKHARHYIGFTPDRTAARRVAEHLNGSFRGNPLIKAALNAGCQVRLAHEFPGASREFERWLKDRKDVRRWCACCGVGARPVPSATSISEGYRNRKARDQAAYQGRAA
jgi:hypothetical protein